MAHVIVMVHCQMKTLIVPGNCLVDTDCAGVCGGDAVVDECGVCSIIRSAVPDENFDYACNCMW